MSDMPLDTLSYLVRRLQATKKTEEDVKTMRIMVEEKIAALIPGPERGQVTTTLSDGTKIVVERGYNYKTNIPEIEKICKNRDITPPIKSKTTIELDITGYEWYSREKPEDWKLLAEYVVATPKKISVQVKLPK